MFLIELLLSLPHEPSIVSLTPTLAALKPLLLTVSRSRCHSHFHSRGVETTIHSNSHSWCRHHCHSRSRGLFFSRSIFQQWLFMVLVILVVLVVFDNVLVDSTLCWLFMVLVILVVFDNVFVGFNSVLDQCLLYKTFSN